MEIRFPRGGSGDEEDVDERLNVDGRPRFERHGSETSEASETSQEKGARVQAPGQGRGLERPQAGPLFPSSSRPFLEASPAHSSILTHWIGCGIPGIGIPGILLFFLILILFLFFLFLFLFIVVFANNLKGGERGIGSWGRGQSGWWR